jgi:hypothetical protein
MLPMLAKTPALLALALVLTGCRDEPPKPPTFVLWEIKYVYAGGPVRSRNPTSTSKRQIEGSLDRVACELIQTKHQQREEKYQALLLKSEQDLIRAGGSVSPSDWTRSDYRCLKTGAEPEAAPPA